MRQKAIAGYTILEVLIFLAITGVLFASAVVAVNGNQAEVQYSQAVRDFEIQIKDVINDVSNGYYPSYERGRCRVNGSGRIGFDASVLGEPGNNEECINIGKNMMFNLEPNRFGVGTIIGVNPQIGVSPDLSLSGLSPTLVYVNGGVNQIDTTTYKPLRFEARVTKIGSDSNPGVNYSSLNFINDFSTSVGGSQTRTNGTLAVNVYGIIGNLTSNSSIDDYKDDVENLETATAAQVTRNPQDGFYICLQTTDNRRARVLIGVDGVVTATKTEFDIDAGAICP